MINTLQVKLVLKRNRYFVETSDATVFEILKSDPTIAAARTSDEGAGLVLVLLFCWGGHI